MRRTCCLCVRAIFCEINVNARMKLDVVTHAGNAVGLKDSVESAMRATNFANGNWVRLGIQLVGDVGVVTSIGGMAAVGPKAAGGTIPEVISPTYRELQGLNKGFQAHHILPQYLGKMLGYTKRICWIIQRH